MRGMGPDQVWQNIDAADLLTVISAMNGAFRLYRAMLCIRSISHGPVSVRLCLSQAGVLLKRQNVG